MEEDIKQLKILIIDDKQSNVDLLVDLLNYHGYQQIKTLIDSKLAMETIDTFNPDILLLDLMMPNVSGFDILMLLQKKQRSADLKVLVLTADIANFTKQQALTLGAHDFLTKPFDLVEVSLRIKNLLINSLLFKQLKKQNLNLETIVEERTAQLTERNKEIQANLDTLKEIAWVQSHVVRAPVARILGLINFLKDSDVSEKDRLNALASLEKSALELDEVVKNITEKTYYPSVKD
ncbi:response regulator [Mongoliitalea lutea]|uniref:Response regulatory domain-containing protein n=1 Tax=Mongoliitalea lutea TaxID=849756 RepID=A0A8J3G3M7_9BACT|nr:response regulator [Mongoliitalea lutea]GHB23666.1 hypothetical protein GCM10008106_00270 [Mongoliitalea lutea]